MRMRIDILSVLPGLFSGVFDGGRGVIGRAVVNRVLEIRVWDLRDFAEGKYRQTDDASYGGGVGMIMKPEPIARAVEDISARGSMGEEKPWCILLSPQGARLDQAKARALSVHPWLLLICGRYEGVDERIRQAFVDEEFSIGDYVLSGGEIPAMVLTDTVGRLVPGVLGSDESAAHDSFSNGLLDHAHYTRPEIFRGMQVPDVLLSGDHEAIRRWRRGEALRRTRELRKDLIERTDLTDEDTRLLESSS